MRSDPSVKSGQPDKAFALTETMNQTQKLQAVSLAGQTLGLLPGMTLAEARAILPALETAPADPDADATALHAIARWCDRYTPLVTMDGVDGLLLDISGCGHLFGGDKQLLTDLRFRLKQAGFDTHIAVASTVGTAWALARYAPNTRVQGTFLQIRAPEEALKPLPVKALRLDTGSVTTLHRLGLKRIGDILTLPRPALARRFRGKASKHVSDLLKRLDQALGVQSEPLEPLQPLPLWRLRHAFTEPIQHLAAVEAALPKLIDDMMTILARADQGVRRLVFSAFRVDGTCQDIMIGTSRPTRDTAHLMRLFAEKLDALQAGFGFDLIMLSVSEAEALPPSQIATIKDTETEATARVLDRLSARLGSGAVVQLKHRHSHIPERAQSYAPAFASGLNWDSMPEGLAARPLRLLQRPEAMDVLAEVPEGAPRRFRWRRVDHKVTRAEGPERIGSEWWALLPEDDPETLSRDYYRIEVAGGARFWVFRRGLYEQAGVRPAETVYDPLNGHAPRWFMHGFFA
ncbi:MAG: DNA polymerase Y family protein [Kordiimonadaceae bacterium]|nr:DNA polymerase Y family protein [Kordiimonadaceae bacterium]MBO6567349.1 DNA polymerase Y family protein [Kordiimonadaceae bacterium]MBO6963437.1 DNA polymerase Y family protein [Kordiimonadaceae bacterium]